LQSIGRGQISRVGSLVVRESRIAATFEKKVDKNRQFWPEKIEEKNRQKQQYQSFSHPEFQLF